ncbi:type II toxin-antitoxin system Phd/YefM family antitoxin [Microbacterium sp. PMB16]|uniref:type II toxin-antitoxin system Phd/YefM family antitoxin n=1 Tax=Microbacterium sp. PMB16 TaxID=3120157 RepID=UPI003F4B4D30
MSTISASAARQTFPAQLDRVEAGEEVSITRHGRVVAVLVRPDLLAARRASAAWSEADRIGALLAEAGAEPLMPLTLTRRRVNELVDSAAADRAAR